MADRPRIYVSGPMSGLPDFNYPAFKEAAAALCRAGWDSVSPTETGQQEGWTWEDYMRAAIALQVTCDFVYMLPGWEQSRGATIEHALAHVFGQRVMYPQEPEHG